MNSSELLTSFNLSNTDSDINTHFSKYLVTMDNINNLFSLIACNLFPQIQHHINNYLNIGLLYEKQFSTMNTKLLILEKAGFLKIYSAELNEITINFINEETSRIIESKILKISSPIIGYHNQKISVPFKYSNCTNFFLDSLFTKMRVSTINAHSVTIDNVLNKEGYWLEKILDPNSILTSKEKFLLYMQSTNQEVK